MLPMGGFSDSMNKLKVKNLSCSGKLFVADLMACIVFWRFNLCTSIIAASVTRPYLSCSSAVLMLNGYSLMRGVLFSIGYFHVITSVYEISGTTWLGVVYGGWTPWVIRMYGCVIIVDLLFRTAGWFWGTLGWELMLACVWWRGMICYWWALFWLPD